jgi:hypothetical protein
MARGEGRRAVDFLLVPPIERAICAFCFGGGARRDLRASHAQKAADFLHGLQPQTGTESAEDLQEAA